MLSHRTSHGSAATTGSAPRARGDPCPSPFFGQAATRPQRLGGRCQGREAPSGARAALTAGARAAATLLYRLAGLGSRVRHGRSKAPPVPSLSPLGGDGGGKAQRPIERVAEPLGGKEAMPGSPAGGGGNPRSALTGPPIAALTGVPLRPNEA